MEVDIGESRLCCQVLHSVGLVLLVHLVQLPVVLDVLEIWGLSCHKALQDHRRVEKHGEAGEEIDLSSLLLRIGYVGLLVEELQGDVVEPSA